MGAGEEDQLAITEFDRLSEKRDQSGKVQDDRVPAKAASHSPGRANNWPAAPGTSMCTCEPLHPCSPGSR